MTRWLDTLPPLDRELGFYLMLACLVTGALARLFSDARAASSEGRDHGPV